MFLSKFKRKLTAVFIVLHCVYSIFHSFLYLSALRNCIFSILVCSQQQLFYERLSLLQKNKTYLIYKCLKTTSKTLYFVLFIDHVGNTIID